MSTSKTYQQSLVDAGSETWPPMLERGPYEFKIFTPEGSTIPRLQTIKDLEGDDLLLHDAEMEVMNMILPSIPNEIYNSQFEKLVNASRAKKLEKSHDPLDLVTNTGSGVPGCFVNHGCYVHGDHMLLCLFLLVMLFVSAGRSCWLGFVPTSGLLLVHTILADFFMVPADFSDVTTVNFYRLDESSEGVNEDFVKSDLSMEPTGFKGFIQTLIEEQAAAPTGCTPSWILQEVIEGMNAPNEIGNVQRTLRTPSSGNTSTIQCYNCSGKGHYARNYPKPRVHEQNDSLFADASRMYEIEELSANICLMARIQPTDHISDDGPSCESAFISEVQSSSINEDNEQMCPSYTKIINSTIADEQAKRYNKQAQSQLVRDRDIIRDLKKQRDKLDVEVKNYKRKNEELQKTHSSLKRKMSEKEDNYHDTIPDLEAKLKKNIDLILKLGNSLQGMFMLGPKPLSVYDQQLKHGLGYSNPYTLKQAILKCPKLYVASSLGNLEIPLNVRDSEDTLEDAFKSKQKMKEKMKDPIDVANKQHFGDSYKAPQDEASKDKTSTSEPSAKQKGRTLAVTTEDMQKRKNDVKAKTTLLLALPDEHQLRFSKYEIAKELWEAILKVFGRNEATKKTRKNQIKQQYGNFKAEGFETLEQTFNRL
ncbi:retrovirus-related pol polyprotein from transposon TNT 1-94 [Tanacetum coccineum]